MKHAEKTVVDHVSVSDAIALLNRAQERGREIRHVISVLRDPKDTSRILAINAVEC
jgi:hypothetical protein